MLNRDYFKQHLELQPSIFRDKMTKNEKQVLADLLKKAIEDAEEMFKTKSHSDAYIIGALQGTIKAVINHLED